ncbi:carboxypeptidase-like regulatory domain-containing protein [Frigoriglobus tundricola]|nr:carboxypeptidase-like regulatory domain-containing protein [Frigoriglobus tundricola]
MSGRVTAAGTGQPVAGARISVFAGPEESYRFGSCDRYTTMTTTADAAAASPPVEFDTVSGTDGAFRFRLPPGGPYRVTVSAPAGSAYLSVEHWLTWENDNAALDLPLTLPAGRIVRGTMRDDAGQPVAGGWVMYLPSRSNRELPAALAVGRAAPVRTAEDGSFVIVVPPGPGTLEGWGATPDYRPVSFGPVPARGKDTLRTFEHARVRLGAGADPTDGAGPPVLTLHRGVGTRVQVTGPDGKPVAAGVAVCRPVVQPLRNLVPRPLAIRDGTFELPGCAPDRVYPVAFLDPTGQAGAVAEVRAGEPAAVNLEPCGAAEVRLVDLAGRPRSGAAVAVLLVLDCDRAATAARGAPGPALVDQSWFDPKHFLPRSVTDADGKVTLRGLVPGADYVVMFALNERAHTSTPFRVRSGQVSRPSDVLVLFNDSSKNKPRAAPFPEED